MRNFVVEPNLVCIVECRVPGCPLPRETFAVEQYADAKKGPKGRDAVINQVEDYLNGLADRTGLTYDMVYWASPERAYGLYPETRVWG